jgi:hypothetical protein
MENTIVLYLSMCSLVEIHQWSMPGFAFKMDGRMKEEEGSIIPQSHMMEALTFIFYHPL